MLSAVTVGGAMIDSIAIIADERIERMSMRNAQDSFLLLPEGRKIEAHEISQHCGGGAINAAVAMARLGGDVATVVKLGEDDRARQIIARLSAEDVGTQWVMRDQRQATGAAIIISSHERDAAIFTFRGANTLLAVDDLQAGMFDASLVYISSLSDASADCFPHIVRLARDAGAKVAVNPGIRQLTSRTASFLDVLGSIDILVVNRVEACALVPGLQAQLTSGGREVDAKPGDALPELLRIGLDAGGYELSLAGFVAALTSCGVGTVLVTNGRDGAYAGSKDRVVHCPVIPNNVSGTAGAGDAFASTFAVWHTETGNVEQALQAAAFNASSVVGFADTQTGLLTHTQITERIGQPSDQPVIRSWRMTQ